MIKCYGILLLLIASIFISGHEVSQLEAKQYLKIRQRRYLKKVGTGELKIELIIVIGYIKLEPTIFDIIFKE